MLYRIRKLWTAFRSQRPDQWIESILYNSRWMLALMYMGLIIAMGLYCLRFMIELWEMCREFLHMTEGELLIHVLSLVDITMIGNLVFVIMIGGYSIFVSEIDIKGMRTRDKPKWLNHVTANSLKIKMGVSLVGVSSIHLLKIFVDPHLSLTAKCVIHVLFVISTMALTWIDVSSHKDNEHAPDPEKPHKPPGHPWPPGTFDEWAAARPWLPATAQALQTEGAGSPPQGQEEVGQPRSQDRQVAVASQGSQSHG
jgi:uncharacterized protein (TIGR00645 family)